MFLEFLVMFAFFSWLPPKKSEIGICLAARENISVSPHRSSVGKKKKKQYCVLRLGVVGIVTKMV